MTPVLSARDGRPDRLMELTHQVRAELLLRGEYLPSTWVEESAQDLRAGRLHGWFLEGPGPGGLAVVSTHGHRAVGHVHAESGAGGVDRAEELTLALLASMTGDARRTDVGVTGLDDSEEELLAARLGPTAGFHIVRRFAMDRAVRPIPSVKETEWPSDLERVPVREIPVAQLAELDWAAFQGTPDESFVAEDVDGDRRLLVDILEGRLGRFLDEASTALITSDHQLVGLLMTGEQSARRAIFLDIVVHPSHRAQGIGRRLVLWGVRALAALGHDSVRLWVTETNVPARKLYDATGFVPVLRTVVYRWDRTGSVGSPHAQVGR
jgi:ribosomal protein S18 acetylase RimI-like enzyme